MTRVTEVTIIVCDKCGHFSNYAEGDNAEFGYSCSKCGGDMVEARFIRASQEYDEPAIFAADPPAEIVEAVTRWLSTCAQSDDDLITRCIQAWPNVAIGDLVRAVSRARDLTKGE